MNNYYTYAYLREDGTPYYIGKGKGKRIYYKNKDDGLKVPKNKNRIVFLKQNLTEEEAFRHEIYMIAIFGRKDLRTGILRNRTNGGEGSSGVIKSIETRTKISQSNKGKVLSKETKKRIGEALKGREYSEETILKMRKAKEGKRMSEDAKRKMSERKNGTTLNEEHKGNISKSLKGKPKPWLIGKKLNDEHKKKVSEALKAIGHSPPSSKNTKWWNDGQINKRSIECPGDKWVLGRLKNF